ncbi:hypothetical protein ACHAPH_007623 [Verticillium nonalfalfae]
MAAAPNGVVRQNGHARQHRAWWKESAVYQIYPASFQDSTGSGVGDLKGITSRVDYMKALGVDIVWLSPIFESPQIDMGYDISDYRKIDPPYGTIEDVDALKDALHARGMKLVLDLVVNHTSDQHEWFKQSRSSKDSPYRDWYIWRPARYDADGTRHPPNNWDAHFQGSAWEWDEHTQEYYLHLFCTEQPDLNWENPAVRDAVHAIMRFWLDRGADGFRLDVINFISKDQAFPDSDRTVLRGAEHYAAGPRLHEYLAELGAILREYDAFSVGEMPCVTDTNEVIKSVRADRGELSMIFHFEFVDLDHGDQGKFSPRAWPLADFRAVADKWQRFILYKDSPDEKRKAALRVEYQKKSRDNARTPMQWTAGPHAGFTTPDATPWMRVHPNHTVINADAQVHDPASVFACWRTVLDTRKTHKDVFVYGDFALVDDDHDKIFAYARTADDGATAVVAANFSADEVVWEGFKGRTVAAVLVTNKGRTVDALAGDAVTLAPYEGVAVLLG